MDIKQKVIDIFTEIIGEQVTENSTCGDMCFDSIDMALSIMEIGAQFEIELTDDDFDKSKTVGDIIKIVEKKVTNGNI